MLFDLMNRNGSLLCHWVGCRKHKKIIYKFHGLFCHKHINSLNLIRNNIKKPNIKPNEEIYWRYQEMINRKIFDKNHIMYIRRLEDKFKF